ncbi:MAG: beta strand repeat-containing protein [Chthoniobacterales bacterium]
MKKFLITLFGLALSASASFAQNVNVNPGAGTYPTLQAAFAAINAGTHTGAVTVDIVASTIEGTNPATLNSSGAGSASYTSVLIRPAADGVLVSGNPATGFGVIQLNGADNVTIDGDNPNTTGTNRNLTISNTAATGVVANSVVRIATSATVPYDSNNNNTIKNLILSGNVTGGNLSTITGPTTSSNSSFGVIVGPNGGATVTAITSVTGAVAAGVTVNNLNVDNNSVNQCARGIAFLGTTAASSTGVTITNNTIGTTATPLPVIPPYTTPATTVYTKGIIVQGLTSLTITGNTIQNIISYVGTTINGIELTSAIGTTGGTVNVSSNTITGVVNNGASAANGVLFSSASIPYTLNLNNVTNVQTVGSASVAGLNLTSSGTSGTINANKVQMIYSRSTGGYSARGILLTSGSNITVQNNFVSDVNAYANNTPPNTSFGVYGIQISAGTGHRIYHNSVNLYNAYFGGTAEPSAAFIINATTLTGLDVRNNIFANTIPTTGASIINAAVTLPSGGTSAMNLTQNNNDYFVSATNFVGSQGTTTYTAANFDPTTTTPATNFRAYTSTLSAAGTNDNASKKVDPQFVSNTDLHIAVASPMVDMGASVGVLQDIDGQNRVSTPDIGADEPSGVIPPANDIAATAITNPPTGSSYGFGGVVTPQATFTNLGTAPQSGVMVQFTITGPGGYSYSDTQTIATINPNQTITVNFAAAPAFTVAGTYTTAATVLTADQNLTNNQVTGSFTVVPPVAGGTYNVPGDYPSLTNPGGIFAAINAAGATGNITINIAANLTGETGANALNELAGGFTVLIKPSGAARTITGASAAGLIKLNGADNVTIDGSFSGGTDRSLTITNTSSGAVIWVASTTAPNGATANTVQNCSLLGAGGTVTNFGVVSSGSVIGAVAEAANSNNHYVNNAVASTFYGIAMVGPTGNETGNQITANDIGSTVPASKLGLIGIFSAQQANAAISLNNVFGATTATTSTASGIQVGGTQSGSTVTRNRIRDIKNTNTGGYGANGIQLSSTSPAANLTVANNFIWDIAGNGYASGFAISDNGYGIIITGGSGYNVWFNSINMGTNQTVAGNAAAINITSGVTTAGAINLRDDIFANTQTAGNTRYAIYSGAANTVFSQIDYNDYYTTGAALGFIGSERVTLANIQAGFGSNTNSKAVNPLFVSASDLHLQPASTLIGMGVAIAGITIDIDGQSRPAVPTIGADEVPAPMPGSIQLSSATYSVNEGAGTLTVTATRTGGSDGAVGVTYATADGTAFAPGDYTAQMGTLAWVDGDAANKTITIPIVDDTLLEGNETFSVALTAPTGGATLGSPASAIVTIVDNDTAPTISIDSVTVSEGGGNAVFTVTQSAASALTTTFQYSTADGTAVAPGDYTAATNVAGSIPAGSLTTTISIPIIDDAIFENTETFTVTLSNAVNATIATGTGTGTINDNDAAPTFTINNVSLPEGNSGTTPFTFTVTKVGMSGQSSTVTYTTVDGTATTANSDYVATSGTLTFGPNDTTMPITVSVNGDTTVEPDETFTVQITGITNNQGQPIEGTVFPFGTGTIQNDDTASTNADLSNLTVSSGTLTPAFGSNTLSYTVSVPFSISSISVTPTAADAGATITVNGTPVASGTASGAIPLVVGPNTITIVVTAADNVTTKTYTITVTRGPANVTVNPGGGGFATLKEAFDAINAGIHTGALTVSIEGDTTEVAPAVLNASGAGAASYSSVSITPNGIRNVSGAIAAGSPLVDLNGANNVTINGLNIAGSSLTFSNTTASGTASTSTIRFINGASNNTVQGCSILGSSTTTVGTAGGNVVFSTSTVAGGNSSNTITGNNLGPAGANLPTKAVFGLGTAANPNTGNMITGNNIYDFFSPTVSAAGVSVQGNNNNWTISNNRIFQTAPRIFTATALRYTGITIASTGNAFTVTGNRIGFGAADGSGTTTISGSTNEFRGLDLSSTSTTTATSVQGNVISGINQTSARASTSSGSSAFIGMSLGTTGGLFNVGTVTGNEIGSLDGSSGIVVAQTSTTASTSSIIGIYDFSFTNGILANNKIGTITINSGGIGTVVGFRGILISGTTGQLTTVQNNTIGGTAPGSITDNIVGTISMYGIQNGSANLNMSGNLIRNMVGNSITVNGVVSSGILTTGSASVSTISQNTVHSLSNNSGGASNSIYAIYCSFAAGQANVVERNSVHSLNMTSTVATGQLVGILPVAGSGTYKNNMVRLGRDAAGNSITTGFNVFGIFEIAGTNNIYFNSAYIGGAGVVSVSNTFAFISNVTSGTRNYRDNIFWNARSNASGAGKNYAITLTAVAGAVSDNNDLYATGTGGFVGRFGGVDQLTLANWQMATGQDANSISADPLFVAPDGNAATGDLHIVCGSPVINSGTPIAGITNDFDNDPRNATTPAIGADELNLTAPTAVSAVSRKTHAGAGTFDILLPLAGQPGIESRTGGANGEFQIVVTFSSPVTVGTVTVTSGTGSVASTSGDGTNTITVNLAGVTNGQYVTIKLGCTDDGTNLGDVPVTVGILLGDVSGNGTVDTGDAIIARNNAGEPTVQSNARIDVNLDGFINTGDTVIVRGQSGTSLPPVAPDAPSVRVAPARFPTVITSGSPAAPVAEIDRASDDFKSGE